jgi:hypothetical protein
MFYIQNSATLTTVFTVFILFSTTNLLPADFRVPRPLGSDSSEYGPCFHIYMHVGPYAYVNGLME